MTIPNRSPAGAFPIRPGGNFGPLQEGALVALNPDLREVQLRARDLLGRFNRLQTPLREGFYEMARRAQLVIADELERRIAQTGRTQRPTRLLQTAMRSPANIDASAEGFVVGTKQALESGPTKYYYRNLETGSRVFVGREVRGFFISSSGSASPPSADRFRRDPRLIQTGPTFGSGRGNKQTTIPVGRSGPGVNGGVSNQGRPGRDRRGTPAPNAGGFRIVIRNPIPAYEYFLVGSRRYLATQHPTEVIKRICEQQGLPYVG